MSYERHPIGAMWPEMTGDAFATLVADVQKSGLCEPIVLYEGKILDGWNRYRACREAGVTPLINPWTPRHEGDTPEAYVLSRNKERRHLEPGQLAMIAAEMLERRKQAGQNTTQQQAANEVGVSRRTMVDAIKVNRDGAAEVIDAAQRGDVSVQTAAQLAALPKAKQPDALKQTRRQKTTQALRDAIAESESSKDALGVACPTQALRDVFASPIFGDTVARLQRIKQELAATKRWAPYVRMDALLQKLTECAQIIEDGTPYAVHTECDGAGCSLCRDVGYVSELRYQEMKSTGAWPEL